MTASPDQIRQDIDRTRAGLAYDVDALAYKASPSRIVAERKRRVVGTMRTMRDTVTGTVDEGGSAVAATAGRIGEHVSDAVHQAGHAVAETPEMVRRQAQGNPLAAGLIAFGAGWLVSSILPGSDVEREAVAQARDALADPAAQLGHDLADAAHDVTANLRDPAQQAVTAVRECASDAVDAVREQATDASHTSAGRADVPHQAKPY